MSGLPELASHEEYVELARMTIRPETIKDPDQREGAIWFYESLGYRIGNHEWNGAVMRERMRMERALMYGDEVP